jgi:CRP-like cAMP-binding protein
VSPEQIPLLQDIPGAALEKWTLTRSYRAGNIIFRQGETTSGLWVVLQGQIAVERLGPDGHIFATGIWLPGDIIGIAGLWDDSPYPATARAMTTPTEVLWMSREHVLVAQREIPLFGIAMCKTLAQRLRLVQESAADTRGRPVIAQVAGVLAILAERMGPSISLTHEELARMLGVQRETITRSLHTLVKEHIISSGHGTVRVHDIDELKEWITKAIY